MVSGRIIQLDKDLYIKRYDKIYREFYFNNPTPLDGCLEDITTVIISHTNPYYRYVYLVEMDNVNYLFDRGFNNIQLETLAETNNV